MVLKMTEFEIAQIAVKIYQSQHPDDCMMEYQECVDLVRDVHSIKLHEESFKNAHDEGYNKGFTDGYNEGIDDQIECL